jgi:hypothetical protein
VKLIQVGFNINEKMIQAVEKASPLAAFIPKHGARQQIPLLLMQQSSRPMKSLSHLACQVTTNSTDGVTLVSFEISTEDSFYCRSMSRGSWPAHDPIVPRIGNAGS